MELLRRRPAEKATRSTARNTTCAARTSKQPRLRRTGQRSRIHLLDHRRNHRIRRTRVDRHGAALCGYDVPNRMARALIHGELEDQLLPSILQSKASAVNSCAKPLEGYRSGLSICPMPCARGRSVWPLWNGKPLYFDDNHLAFYGAERVKGLFGGLVQAAKLAASRLQVALTRSWPA